MMIEQAAGGRIEGEGKKLGPLSRFGHGDLCIAGDLSSCAKAEGAGEINGMGLAKEWKEVGVHALTLEKVRL